MAKTLKDLALALLNATLILIALCLLLALMVTKTVNGMVGEFASNLKVIEPVRGEIQTMTDELRGVRQDLAAIKDGTASPAVVDRLETRLDAMATRADAINARLDGISDKPEQLLNHAIEKAGQQAADTVNSIRGCQPGGTVTAAPAPTNG